MQAITISAVMTVPMVGENIVAKARPNGALEALMLGGLCVFLGWTLFGFVAARFYRLETAAKTKNPGLSLQE